MSWICLYLQNTYQWHYLMYCSSKCQFFVISTFILNCVYIHLAHTSWIISTYTTLHILPGSFPHTPCTYILDHLHIHHPAHTSWIISPCILDHLYIHPAHTSWIICTLLFDCIHIYYILYFTFFQL